MWWTGHLRARDLNYTIPFYRFDHGRRSPNCSVGEPQRGASQRLAPKPARTSERRNRDRLRTVLAEHVHVTDVLLREHEALWGHAVGSQRLDGSTDFPLGLLPRTTVYTERYVCVGCAA